MKECELTKGGRIFGLLAVTRFAPDRKQIINLNCGKVHALLHW